MSHNKSGLMWFRADLRTVDNTALLAARETCDSLVALYLATPMQWHEHHVAPIQIDFIHRRLQVLREQLRALNIPLQVMEVADFSEVPAAVLSLVDEHQVGHVFCNKQYEWNELQRDHQTGHLLSQHQIKFSAFDDSCVIPPGEVLTQKGDPFKVYTPFRREWLKQFRMQGAAVQPVPAAVEASHALSLSNGSSVGASGIAGKVDEPFTYPQTDSMAWPVDEEAIRQRLLTFCEEKAEDYHKYRDFPAFDGTSCLSPYLALGLVSPRQCLAVLLHEAPNCLDEPESGAFCWLNELVWREFYRHLMVAFPQLSRNQPFIAWTRNVQWQESDKALKAWQQGLTGFPIVDAAMRQLKTTGWMHNRLRMITASFLTKDLLIHWQAGEQWFFSHLIDGDLAANNGGWQWAASTGTDAQPYFRVFNPTTQSERFDPKGEFIRKWVHELKDVPDKYIHEPHKWPGAVTLKYPKPIVDHKAARLRAIDRFKLAKGDN